MEIKFHLTLALSFDISLILACAFPDEAQIFLSRSFSSEFFVAKFLSQKFLEQSSCFENIFDTLHFPATLRIFNSPQSQHAAFSTLLISTDTPPLHIHANCLSFLEARFWKSWRLHEFDNKSLSLLQQQLDYRSTSRQMLLAMQCWQALTRARKITKLYFFHLNC